MFPNEPELIERVASAALFLSLAWYVWIAYFSNKAGHRIDAFLRFREDYSTEARDKELLIHGIEQPELLASFMASALSLASAIYVYVQWAAQDKLFVIWSPVSWAAGVVVLAALHKRIFTASRSSWTLHSYLGRQYDDDRIIKLSSAVTTVVFLLQVAAEVVVGLAVLRAFLSDSISLTSITFLMGGVFIFYCLVGGLPAVLKTDKLQYRLICFALLFMVISAMDHGGKTALQEVASSFKTIAPQNSLQWIMLASLFALNLPLQITDMSVWQRIAASKDTNTVKGATWSFAFQLLFWMGLIVVFSVGFSSAFTQPTSDAPQNMISFFKHSWVYPFLITGFIAALLSTADTFLISAVQTLVVDWKYRSQFKAAGYNSNNLPQSVQGEMIQFSRVLTLIFGVLAIAVGLLAYNFLPLLLQLLFVTFALQTALAPAIIAALYDKAGKLNSKAAIYSVSTGGAVALAGFAGALFDATVAGIPFAFLTPILSLFAATVIFLKYKSNGAQSNDTKSHV